MLASELKKQAQEKETTASELEVKKAMEIVIASGKLGLFEAKISLDDEESERALVKELLDKGYRIRKVGNGRVKCLLVDWREDD